MYGLTPFVGMTVRMAVRSRMLVLLAVLVAACVAGLPRVVRGDGSAGGEAQVYLSYAFGLSSVLLSGAAAWAAAGAVSLEVSGRQAHLLRTKPVWPASLWVGKWLGLMALNAALLGMAGGLTYSFVLGAARRAQAAGADGMLPRNDVLTAQSWVLPEQAPAPVTGLGTRPRWVVPPGGAATWQFPVPAGRKLAAAMRLQFRFAASHIERQRPVTGAWRVTAGHRCLAEAEAAYTPHLDHQLRLAPIAAAEADRITATYRNTDVRDPATILFVTDDGVRLRVREGGWAGNVARALLLVLARLGLCSALGLTAGCLFSFPVAVFAAGAYLLMIPLSAWTGPRPLVVETGGLPVWLAGPLAGVGSAVATAVYWLTPPMARFDPLSYLSTGTTIPWALVGEAWAVLVLGYGGVLACLGIWLFRRRELGLAG